MTPEQNGAPEAISAELVAIERGQQLKTQEAIAEAERRAELLARITIAAVKRTYPQDWIDFQGSPYLSSAGAERLRTLFGLSITDLETKRYEERDKEGVFWFFVVTGTAHWRGDDFAMMGTCSSRDLFFRTRYQGNDKVLLPADEVDPTNIVKAAYSNMVANAVTRILGLRDLTWDQLKDFNPGTQNQADDFIDVEAAAISDTPERIKVQVKDDDGQKHPVHWRPQSGVHEVKFER